MVTIPVFRPGLDPDAVAAALRRRLGHTHRVERDGTEIVVSRTPLRRTRIRLVHRADRCDLQVRGDALRTVTRALVAAEFPGT